MAVTFEKSKLAQEFSQSLAQLGRFVKLVTLAKDVLYWRGRGWNWKKNFIQQWLQYLDSGLQF